MPYFAPNIATVIPPLAHIHSHVWCNNTLVLNFSIVEWYNMDQVMRKFGCKQDISDVLQNFNNVNKINKRGKNQRIWHKSINNILHCGMPRWSEDLRWILIYNLRSITNVGTSRMGNHI
ncbi:hypothetical protein J1N35_022103 [Gossypium stocksii]|uniref:Uncharacterized protein n=1 Tax=Gossypium stocksii TaxID=47602 RepID=A0A9D4A2G2_9ROSI|nr:hypothetical protein J1N35_022103 [Gossypium stocksii]